MKLLHTSDWHLGMTVRGGVNYEDDQKFFINEICKIAKEENVDGIMIAGDIFDKSIASSEAIKLYDDTVTRICADMNIPVFIIAGNHDGAERISQCNELLKKSGLYIAGSLTEKPQVVNKGDVDIYLLPWISTDKVRAVYPDKKDEISSMEDAYRVVLDKYRESFKDGHKNILVAHAYIVDGQTSESDMAAIVGQATMVGSDVFEGFDYVALGHLHGPQKINDKIRYSGTPMPYSFGKEEKQEKSVVIIDTESLEQKVIPLELLHKRCTLKGTYRELMDADHDKDILDAYVRLEVTDSYVGPDLMAAFMEKYGNLVEAKGKDYDKADASITMTLEDLEKATTDPEIVFKQYFKDMIGGEVDDHYTELFKEALDEYEKGVIEE
ncbi:MAG: exonuclease SbcCD subunit D [Lachnospiraceae bacterium]|nr:exonuclease SbcCD subunit D [Lachnospiraceae bacterium]